ncbi:hypothetical protein Hdeb2414_s0087g00785791 [Helianthus debilis subsp. tardiflorus]
MLFNNMFVTISGTPFWYDIIGTLGLAADVSHINPKSEVEKVEN